MSWIKLKYQNIVMAFMLLLCSQSAYSDNAWTVVEDGVKYEICYNGHTKDWDFAQVKECIDKRANLIIPDSVTYRGTNYPVRIVEFRKSEWLEEIALPKTVDYVDFYNCENLRSVQFSEGITRLAESAFAKCTHLTDVSLPNTLTSIEKFCFEGCTSLAKILIPNSVSSMEYGCFAGCTKLKDVRLSDNLKVTDLSGDVGGSISNYRGSFEDCVSLETITLPEKLDTLGSATFKGCTSLKEIKFNKNLKRLENWCFYGCTSLEEISIPESVVSIGIRSFSGCKALANVVIPSKNIILDSYCFDGCGFTAITVSPKWICNGCVFSNCENLTSVTVAEGVEKLSSGMFYNSPNLHDVSLPSTLKEMGLSVFHGCQKCVFTILAKEPPTFSDASPYDSFGYMPIVFVPDGSKEKYVNSGILPQNLYVGIPVSSISALPSEISIDRGKSDRFQLNCTVQPENATTKVLRWYSSNPDVASVDDSGLVTALSIGDAVVTVRTTDGTGYSSSVTVHVPAVKVSEVVAAKEISLYPNDSWTLEYEVLPELADDKRLTVSITDTNIAFLRNNSSTGKKEIYARKAGATYCTLTAQDGSGVSAKIKITVKPMEIELSTKTITLKKDETYTEQKITVKPDRYGVKDVSWTSNDESIVTVDENGVITAKKPGIASIRYKLKNDNSVYADCKVIVYADNVVYVGGIYYILDKESKEATVTSIYGGKNTSLDATKVAQYYSGTINIPETIIYDGDKYTVKYVGSYAFNCQNELQSIIVPRTVTIIQDNAAIHAENLNRVNVANESQLVSIGKQAFMECTGLKRFTFDGTSLSMNLIDKEAFKNCTALERVTWMDDTSIKTIGNSAFYGCSALEKVQWMKKSELKTIQDYAFFKCVSLNNFEMPNTTLSVGNSSFRYNSSLTNIHLSTSLNYIDEYAFGECGFSQITLPESLANIQAGAFINNEHLQEITLPERLQGLGSAAFENNLALESVTFKTAIETMTIGNNAFNQCPILNKVYITNLNSFAQTNFNNAKANPANTSQHIYDANGKEIINVVLPKGTKYVNNNAFNGCAYIKSIEMPATMDHVNDDIFYGCSGLKDVYCYAEDVPDFIGVNDPSSMDAVFKQATLHVPFGSEAKYQKDTEWWGRFGSIQGCDPQPTQVVTQIDLSTRTVNLKMGTTYNEQKITVTPAEAANVRIKYSTADRNVADIDEDGVIHGVAAGVTTITYTANDGSGVTAECKVIVREPEVEYVGDLYYLFDKAKKQATVTSIYGGKNTSLDAEKVAQYYTGTVNIPEQTTFDAVTYDVKAIGGYAFTCQNDLQALRVGAFVEEIADNAATKAMNLNRITVANASQLKNIGKEAFMDCTGLQHVLFEGTTQSMEAINTAAFKNCTALQDVIWEGKSTLNLIGNSAFYGCSKLETVKWNDLCTLQVIDDYAFYQCSSLNHFMMPNSTLSVGKYSFRYDAALTDISLSTSLSIIYDYAFGECGFTQIVLPESLKSLQAGAFINNSYLADITIPKKLEGIGAGAFENNDALETVTFKTHETKLTVDKNAFNCCPVLSKVNIDYLDDWAHINFQNAAANPASTAHRLYLNNVEIIDVNLPSGTKYIGNNVFNGCSNIRTLTVPATVEHINDNIIYGCSALRDVYCYAAKVPQFIGTEDASAMSDVFSQATLHVIYGNEAAYKADSWWGRFYKVEGCNAPSDTDVKVSSITISQTEATLKPDDTMQLEATVYPTNAANKKINWSSSNEDVAQVTEDGFVLAITEGEADITAEAADGSGIKAVCHITVENEKKPVVPIVEIKFEQSPVTIALGESFKLNVIFNPTNASNKQLTWTTTSSAVATVDPEGNVYGVSEGKTIITAKTTDGSNLIINCVVTVSKTTGVGNITMGDVKIILDKRHLKVEGLADNDIVQIVNTIGFTVYKGTEHEMDLDAPGIYIIKVKGKTLKFSVK